MRVSPSLCIVAALVATSVTAQAPDASFKQVLAHGGTRLAGRQACRLLGVIGLTEPASPFFLAQS